MKLVEGNHACVEGAIAVGVRFYAGYPITPSSEIAEEMSRALPKVGGIFIQMEDEIASMGACIGARLAGVKSMTATSGPGFSLMQEHIGFAAMTEVPVLIVDVMRGGPSTGLPTKTSQQDIMQARWGSHGDYSIVALAPWNVYECFELTVKAVNISEMLRLPVVLLSDEVVGHMVEGAEFPEEVEIYDPGPLTIPPEKYIHYDDGTEYGVPRADYGKGYRFHATGLAHDKDGFPTNNPEKVTWLLNRFFKKIDDNMEALTDYRIEGFDDPDILFVAIGTVARTSMDVIHALERKGIRAALFRPRIVWPFPEKHLSAFDGKVAGIVVPEMNRGQLIHPVREVIKNTAVYGIHKYNGEIISPDEIMAGMKAYPISKAL
ncbi:MAG: 2-oxoacid:acceptor oxidoreductase subunit alpha [candidate division WOR-3 bacterium]